MRIILKIAKAELSTLFYSPIAWFLAVIFLFQCALIYTGTLEGLMVSKNLGGPYLENLHALTMNIFGPPQGLFSMVTQKVYLYIPLLTMGLISREISSGTIKLLYSAPIKIRQIVYGKFLAMMIYNFLLILLLFIVVISGLKVIHAADVGLLFSGLFGIYLLLAAYSAIGIFMSSLTSYQIVAALGTLVIFAVLQYIGAVWQDVNFVRDLTYFLSISGRTGHMLVGLISTKDVMYFCLIVYIFLGFCIAKLQTERESKKGLLATWKYVLIFVPALAVGYASSLPGLIGYYDATINKDNTLTDNTQKIVKELGDAPLEVTAYVNLLDGWYYAMSPIMRKRDQDRWERYLRFKANIKLRYVYYYDLAANQRGLLQAEKEKNVVQLAKKFAKSYKVNLADFLTPKEIHKIIDLSPEMNRTVMELKYKGHTTFLRLYSDAQGFPSETETDAALKRLLTPVPKIAFVTGEFERSINKFGDREYGALTNLKNFRYSLVNQGFDVETISLQQHEITKDIAALVIADPKINFSPEILAKIQEYINNGGNILIAGEPGKQSILNPVILPLGVQMNDGILVETSKDNTPNIVKPLFTKAIQTITGNLEQQLTDSIGVSMPGVSGLTYTATGKFSVLPLLMTDEKKSWNKKGKLVIDSADVAFSVSDGDDKKSVPTVLALTRKIGNKQQRIIIAGDADFLSDVELGKRNTANFSFGTDLFGWFSNGQFPIDTSRPAAMDNMIDITDSGLTFLKILLMYILPGLILSFAAIFLIRRKRN